MTAVALTIAGGIPAEARQSGGPQLGAPAERLLGRCLIQSLGGNEEKHLPVRSWRGMRLENSSAAAACCMNGFSRAIRLTIESSITALTLVRIAPRWPRRFLTLWEPWSSKTNHTLADLEHRLGGPHEVLLLSSDAVA